MILIAAGLITLHVHYSIALAPLSLEKFHQSQQQKHTTIPSDEVTLPVNYGRKPLSEEEIAIINVRDRYCMYNLYCFFIVRWCSCVTEY